MVNRSKKCTTAWISKENTVPISPWLSVWLQVQTYYHNMWSSYYFTSPFKHRGQHEGDNAIFPYRLHWFWVIVAVKTLIIIIMCTCTELSVVTKFLLLSLLIIHTVLLFLLHWTRMMSQLLIKVALYISQCTHLILLFDILVLYFHIDHYAFCFGNIVIVIQSHPSVVIKRHFIRKFENKMLLESRVWSHYCNECNLKFCLVK